MWSNIPVRPMFKEEAKNQNKNKCELTKKSPKRLCRILRDSRKTQKNPKRLKRIQKDSKEVYRGQRDSKESIGLSETLKRL